MRLFSKRRKASIAVPDAAIALLLLSLFGYFIFHVSTHIQYQWNWSAIPGYMFRYDATAGKWVPNLLMEGFFTTIRLSIWATILAVIIGMVMGVFRTSQSLFKRMIGRTYVELVRNTPPLVLIFIFYFFISDQIMTALKIDSYIRSLPDGQKSIITFLFASPAHFSGFLSALLTLAIYEGAYITEIVRSGLESVEKKTVGGILCPGALMVSTDGVYYNATGDQTNFTAVSGPDYFNHQGFCHRFCYFNSGVDISGAGIDGRHISDFRNLDYHHSPLFYPDFFLLYCREKT